MVKLFSPVGLSKFLRQNSMNVPKLTTNTIPPDYALNL